jgi:thiol-disulfide isomerase/thioredoxin
VIILAGAIVVAAACGQHKAPVAMPVPPPPVTQAAPAGGAPAALRPPAPPPLLGHVTRAALHEYAPWTAVWERPYTPDPAVVVAVKAHATGVSVVMVMATWCPDSKRELPRYFATMDAAGIGDDGLTMVGVDRTKKDAEGLTEKYGITRVPTFVFLRDGKEIGRFVERTPAGSTFEAEVAKILGG